MNPAMYKEIVDLMDIFADSSCNGEKVVCYELIKDIIDGKILKDKISINAKMSAKKQLVDSLEWLQSFGVTIKYKEEIVSFLD